MLYWAHVAPYGSFPKMTRTGATRLP
jgi:hypothetical protein